MTPDQLMQRTYDVTVKFVVRVNAPHPKLAENAAMGAFSLSGVVLRSLQDVPTAKAEELLFGAEHAQKGPRNPNRTDIGENGHKVESVPEPEVAGPKLHVPE